MQPETLKSILNKLPGHHGYTRSSFRIESGRFGSVYEVEDMISAGTWAGASGWIARQSGVVMRPEMTDAPGFGAVIEAELGTPEASLQMRRLTGGWVWTRIDEVAGGAQLSDDIVLVTTGSRTARYRRYWTLPDDGAAEIIACRLVGIGEIA
jgi:hypothetical protein